MHVFRGNLWQTVQKSSIALKLRLSRKLVFSQSSRFFPLSEIDYLELFPFFLLMEKSIDQLMYLLNHFKKTELHIYDLSLAEFPEGSEIRSYSTETRSDYLYLL